MQATLSFNFYGKTIVLGDVPVSGLNKDELIDLATRVVQGSVVKAAADMLGDGEYSSIQEAYTDVRAATGGDLPFVIHFDDGTEEEKIADTSIEGIRHLLWGEQVPHFVKDQVRTHVRSCNSSSCPVNATYALLGLDI